MATINNFNITSVQNNDILLYSNGSWINSNISAFFGILDGRYSVNTHNHDGQYMLKDAAYTKSQTYPAASLYTRAEIDAMFNGYDGGGGGGGTGLVTSAKNVGTGSGVFHSNSSGELQFRSLYSADLDLLTIGVSGTSIVFGPKTPTWTRLVSDNGQLTTSHVNFANQGLNTTSSPSFAGLTVNTGSWSSTGLKLTGAAPSIYFSQNDSTNLYAGVNGDNFYLLPDSDSNGSFESPYTLQVGITSGNFYYRGNEVYHEGHKPTWDEVTGRPSTFTPSTHNHSAANITSGTFNSARLPTITSSMTNFANQDLNTTSGPTFSTIAVSGSGAGSRHVIKTEGSGGIWQVSDRGGLMLTSGDDSLILANGDVGRSFSTNLDPVAEVTYILSDAGIVFKTDLQEGWGSEYTFEMTNTGLLRVGGNNVYHRGDKVVEYGGTNSASVNDPNYATFIRDLSSNVASEVGLPSEWHHIINMAHSNNNGYGGQIAMSFGSSPTLRFRASAGTTFGSWNEVYHEGHKPTWSEVLSKPLSFPPSTHTHPYTDINFNGSFNINGSGPGGQSNGVYVSSVATAGSTNNPTYTAILSAQVSTSRSVHFSVDGDGYLYGMRTHSNAGTYTFESKTRYSDESSIVKSIGRNTVPSSRNVLKTGLFHYSTRAASDNPPHSSNYGESLVWGNGQGGSVELWGGWVSNGWGRLYTRALRDTTDNWSSWYEVYTSREPRMQAIFRNGYEGMASSEGSESNWIRTTSNGIIPYQSGGYSSLGTSSWPFSNVYSNNFYGSYMSLSNRLDVVNGVQVSGIDKGIYFSIPGYNDQGGIRFRGEANTGYMEFWTADDYQEPFVFRMYDSGNTGPNRTPLIIDSNRLTVQGELLLTDDAGIVVRTSTNGAGAKITFSDNTSNNYSQRGFITYKHSNNAFGMTSGDGFEVSGSEVNTVFVVRGEGWAEDWVATSDRRKKDNLEVIESSLDKLSTLVGYTYDQTTLKQRKAGIVAQDLQKVLPEAVNTGGDDMLNVSPMGVIALLVNAVNELAEQVKEIKNG